MNNILITPATVSFVRQIAGVIFFFLTSTLQPQVLKSVVYDFDGFDLGSSSLPEGDYSYGDLQYEVAVNPLNPSDMLGDRVLKLELNWDAGYGAFGRGIRRFIELNKTQDRFNFYFYNPVSNTQAAIFEIKIADDDNQNNTYETTGDDNWKKTFTVSAQAGWQLVTCPLSALTDDNPEGNGVFDIAFTQNAGMLLLIELRFSRPSANVANAIFYLDMLCFTEGAMPTGAGILDLPSKKPGDHCLLGAHQKENPGEYWKIPSKFEALFPAVAGKKIKYVNTYLQWATNGSATPHALPGTGYQTLMDNGYRPVLTWEPSFSGFSPLDPAQPKLQDIIDGDYNTYIDAFADKIKTYSDTVIIRLMHEFDGDWYSWCISQNGNDPQKFVNAFRKIVDRFKAKNVNNVLWMWCPNSDFTPNEHWNWIVAAYPGDSYVDIVATDVYNSHYPENLPWWRSFRWQTTETYYYLTKYFPAKPYFICELASRERQSTEAATSQTKAGWFAAMDKDLQSHFRKTRAIIFFSENKTQDWQLNTSPAALKSATDNIWMDDYYFLPKPALTASDVQQDEKTCNLYPNPSDGRFFIEPETRIGQCQVKVYDIAGKEIMHHMIEPGDESSSGLDLTGHNKGVYYVEIRKNIPGDRVLKKLVIK
jgi:hypothetical protein